MASLLPSTATGADHGSEARRLTRWSLWLFPAGIAWMYLLGTLTWLFWVKLRDRGEASVALTDYGLAGWTAMIVLDLLGLLPCAAGAWLGLRALRRGGRWGAAVGLALNAAVVVFFLGSWILDLVLQA